jgi:hypothetical protein
MADEIDDPTKFYSNTPKGAANMTPAMQEKIARDKAPFETVELPGEPSVYSKARTIDVVQRRSVPQHIIERLTIAHKAGRLPQSYDHWIGVIRGADLGDASAVRELQAIRKQITRNRKDDEAVLPKIAEIISGLQAKKR